MIAVLLNENKFKVIEGQFPRDRYSIYFVLLPYLNYHRGPYPDHFY